MTARARQAVLLLPVWVVAALATLTIAAGPAAAAGERAGGVVVVDADDRRERLDAGGSATPFSLRLPSGASCQGDSANDQYRFQTFLVPATDDPGTLRYGEIAPEGDGRWALFGVDTVPVVHQLTDLNDGAGQAGRIGGLPALDLAVYPPGTFPDGRYRVGVACSLFRETTRYWDTSLVLTNDDADRPAGLRWASAATDDVDDATGTSAAPLAGIAGLALAATVLVRRRRANRSERAPLEGR